ncbi:serine/threonine-protein kinase [Spirillospora sp. NPDC047279]|uniref:serine/threonine-protein kinase n=1 Tax=Spirillospora sp. NPDC047279 TaxID=3155478 RepID=UPI0033DC98BA
MGRWTGGGTLRGGVVLGGRYRMARQLGRGAMGEVWRAWDLLLRRPVAVKILHRHLGADPGLVERFRQEFRVVGALRHEGVTVAYDAGEDGGVLFYVMELLEGEDLYSVLARAPDGLSVERVLHLGEQVAEALGAAHERGIVHRDIKPSNLVLLAGDRVKICDFGIARFVQEDDASSTAVGTPEYMAPEQGRGGAVDGRADLYALGCVLHALLVGRPPFEGRHLAALVHQHMNARVESLRARRAEIPQGLDDLVLALLAKDPDDRPGDAVTVGETLRAIREGRMVEIDVPEPAEEEAPEVSFRVEVSQNEYLPPGGDDVQAVVSVTCEADEDGERRPPVSMVFVVGCSWDMDRDEAAAVREAIADAIDLLGERDRFAVIAGSETVDWVYPRTSRLVAATPAAKAEARRAMRLLRPARRAAFGLWLRIAFGLLAEQPTSIRHAVLLTNMAGDVDIAADLRAAVVAAGGVCTCDVRGIGNHWNVQQLRAITEPLDGSLDLVASARKGLRTELAEIVERTRGQVMTGVALRVRTPRNASVEYVKELYPRLRALPRDGDDHPLRAWRRGRRDYHLAVRVEPGEAGAHRLAAWVELVREGEEVLASGRLFAAWSADGRATPGAAAVRPDAGTAPEPVRSGAQAGGAGDPGSGAEVGEGGVGRL